MNEELSLKEIACLQLIALGKTNIEAGKALGLTHHTIQYHLHNAYHKLNVTNRAAAISKAYHLALIKLPIDTLVTKNG